jgi:hypothetical protein
LVSWGKPFLKKRFSPNPFPKNSWSTLRVRGAFAAASSLLTRRGKRRPESWAKVGVYVISANFATVESTLEFHCVFNDAFRSLQEGLDKVSEAQVFTSPLIPLQRGTLGGVSGMRVPL